MPLLPGLHYFRVNAILIASSKDVKLGLRLFIHLFRLLENAFEMKGDLTQDFRGGMVDIFFGEGWLTFFSGRVVDIFFWGGVVDIFFSGRGG